MNKHVNTYKGLTTDVSYEAIANNMYIDAEDIRITTDKGESNGAWANIKGNTFSFTLPVLNTISDPFGAWTALNPEVIGYCTIREKILLLVADDSGTKGWIYELRYSPVTLTLLPNFPALIYYNSNLNFNKQNPIKAVGRYENDVIQRIYWTDYNNFLRSINIVAQDLTSLPVGAIDIYPNVEYKQPLLKSVVNGGNHKAGIYLVAYRLKTVDGKQTLISPPGHPFHVTISSETFISSQSYVGSTPNEDTTKAFLIEIDTTSYVGVFSELEIIKIYYNTLTGLPVVTSVGTKEIDSNSLEFLITGFENTSFVLDNEEYNVKSYPFKTAKALVQIDNSLLVSNIKESFFDIQSVLGDDETFDAKTGRYNTSSQLPHPLTGTVEEIKEKRLKNAFNVSTASDANQGYNTDAHWDSAWHSSKQYKYKADGSTLGGEGLNISYSFFLEPFIIDGQGNSTGGGNIPNLANIPEFIPHNLGYGVDLYNTTYPSLASPFYSGVLKGYKRGETYRFGIVFYSKKGETSFVEFIGDIKFPDISEKDGIANESGTNYWILSSEGATTPDGVITKAYSLGVKFNIDFSTCPNFFNNEIESFQFVRLERETKDKKRITQGIMRMFSSIPINAPTADYDLRGPGDTNNVLHLLTTRGGDELHSFYNLNDNINGPSTTVFSVPGDFISFLSPELSYRFNDTGETIESFGNPCVLITGAYGGVNSFSFSSQDLEPNEQLAKNCEDRRFKARRVYPIDTPSPEYIKVWATGRRFFKMINSYDYKETAGPFSSPPYYLRNYYANPDTDGISSAGSLNDPNLGSTPTKQGEISKGGTALVGKIGKLLVDPLTNTAITSSSAFEFFNAPSVVKPLPNGDPFLPLQSFPITDILLPRSVVYGGYTKDVLENNIFIAASPIIDKSFSSNLKVLNGDIFLNMFPLQTSMIELNTDFYDGGVNSNYRTSKARTLSFVAESSINIDLDHGSTIKRGVSYTEDVASNTYTVLRQENNNTNTGIITYAKSSNMYAYNQVYSKESNNLTFFIKPEILSAGAKVNDIRSYLSTVKINGEDIDSWTQFPILSYYDVDDFGPINEIVVWKSNVYFFQDKAFGVFSINPTQVVPSTDGSSLEIGSSDGFSNHNYFSTETGSIHQYGVKATENGIFYFDALNKKLMFFSGGQSLPFSDVKGIHSLMQFLPSEIFLRKSQGGDNSVLNSGIAIGRDKKNDEIIFSFKGSGKTSDLSIVIDELTQFVVTRLSTPSNFYIENQDILISANPDLKNNYYTHNVGNWGSFYGNIKECFIKLVINPNADLNKVLRFLEFNSIVRSNAKEIDRTSTITAFRIETEHQDTGKILYSLDRFRHKFNKWRLKIPRDINSVSQRGRLRNTFFIVTLYYDNANNKEIIVNSLNSYFDVQTF